MFKRLFFSAAVVALMLANCQAAGQQTARQSGQKIVMAVERVSPSDGQTMYINYCAPCHGASGRGYGSMSIALRNQPVDLSALAKRNHGKYPEAHVISVLLYGSGTPTHGTGQMPVWGTVFPAMDTTRPLVATLRVANLTHYLRSIQTD